MRPVIKIVAITPDGEREVTQLEGGYASIGREPENTIVVDSNSVSRRHACIIEAGSQWVFRDLGSTNGSRVNGVETNVEEIKLLRSGDVIGIADFQMRVDQFEKRTTKSLPRPGVSLLIFSDEKFVSEFPLPRSGSSFIVGGPEGHLYLSGEQNDSTQLEILFEANVLSLNAVSRVIPVLLNGNALRGEAELSDRDEIIVGHYQIVVSFPESDPDLEVRQAAVEQAVVEEVKQQEPVLAYDRPNVPEHLKPTADDGWASESSRRKTIHRRFVFGTDPTEEGISNTLSMEKREFQQRVGFEMNPSQRFNNVTLNEEVAPRAISKKFLVLLFLVIVLVIGGIAGVVISAFA